MKRHVHLLGGTGRIGMQIINKLKKVNPYFSNVWIYCDGQKASFNKESENNENIGFKIEFLNYSAFSIQNLINQNQATENDYHLVINLRGINNKKFWLTNPLDALDLNTKYCKFIIDSDIWKYPNIRLIHLSSKLCEFIEGNYSMSEICEGHDSYRNAYMISRLYQEVLLTSYSYKRSINTNFIRLPAIYGYEDDYKVPWVLNSFIKEFIQNNKIIPKNPNARTWLTHHQFLVKFLEDEIFSKDINFGNKTMEYIDIPSLDIQVKDLAELVVAVCSDKKEELEKISREIVTKQKNYQEDYFQDLMINLIQNIKKICFKKLNF